jgi:flagellar basal-body rod protein FlgF
MDISIYNLSSGMKAEELFLDIVANNIANVSTSGFKKQSPYFHLIFMDEKNKLLKICGSYTDFSSGPIIETKDKRDLAIQGEGFFTLEKNGEYFYARTLKIFKDKEGYLIDENGSFILGNNGRIKVIGDFFIDENGQIYDENKNIVDKLKITLFENMNLISPKGENYFVNNGSNIKTPQNFSILQGYRENSNVNIVEEMLNLINISRVYETIQKNIQSLDYLYERLINTLR